MHRGLRAAAGAACLAAVLLATFSGCLQRTGVPDGDDGGGRQASYLANDQFLVHVGALDLPPVVDVGDTETWRLRVTNLGETGGNRVTYNALCGGPWRVTMMAPDGNKVMPKQPAAECDAYAVSDLLGGMSLDHEWSWNGRLWDEARGTFVDAAAGRYTLTFTFDCRHLDSHPATPNGVTLVDVR